MGDGVGICYRYHLYLPDPFGCFTRDWMHASRWGTAIRFRVPRDLQRFGPFEMDFGCSVTPLRVSLAESGRQAANGPGHGHGHGSTQLCSPGQVRVSSHAHNGRGSANDAVFNTWYSTLQPRSFPSCHQTVAHRYCFFSSFSSSSPPTV